MESEGRRIHGLAAQAREENDLTKSLGLIFEAFSAYVKAGDQIGASEVLADGSISFRNYGELNDSIAHLIIAKKWAEASVELARKSNIKEALALPLYNLAKCQEATSDLEDAVKNYKEAVQNLEQNPPASHNRPAILADFKIHLANAEYRNGDKSALDRSLSALSDLESSQEDDYNKHVWLSGAHMDIASMLQDEDLDLAKKHLKEAEEIIKSDPKLVIRALQLEKLSQKING